MWRCPNCSEQVDDGFDACWNCGTAPDGTIDVDFRTEPSNAAGSHETGEPEEPPAVEDSSPEPAGAEHPRIVELCSAADIAEAHGLCDLLEEEGIPARVVGEYLAGAAGSLPLGDSTSPRIWVREADLARASEFLNRQREPREPPPAEPLATGEPPEWETPAEQDEVPLPSDVRFRFLSQGFYIAGLVCVLGGAIWAWQNYAILSRCSAATDGRRISSAVRYGDAVPMPGGPDQPIGRQVFYPARVVAQYKYVVDQKAYYADFVSRDEAPTHLIIHYDPHAPARHVIGAVAPAWVILVCAFASCAFLMFVGYQFR